MSRSLRLTASVVCLTLATTMSGSGVSAAQEGSPEASLPPLEQVTGDTYVGATSNPDLFVAVVVSDDAGARAYLCDSTGISEWLTGTDENSALALTSASGAALAGTIGAQGVTGTATLADGTEVSFAAAPAAGVGGLYTSVITADRRVRGTSSTGGTLDGVIAEEPLAEDRYPLLGFLTAAGGTPVGFVVALDGADVPDETRSITLNDGQQRGRSKKPGRVWVTDPMALPIQDGTSNT
jgi:hypothetical protein